MFFYKKDILGPSGAVFRIIQIPFFDHEIFVVSFREFYSTVTTRGLFTIWLKVSRYEIHC